MKIMLVEDDTFFQQFYALKLKEKGYEVEVASDGEEGITKIKSFSPQLVLLDLIMPKKDGFTVLQEMQNDPTLKTIPVIVFSTLGQKPDVEKAKQFGAVDYMDKSFFDFEKLLQKITQHTINVVKS